MMTRLKYLAASLFAGVIYPLGFAPFSWWPLALLSVSIIFLLWDTLSRRDALLSATIFGLGVYGVGVSWLYVSMVNFGGMAPFMAVIAVILFALILSSFLLAIVFVYKFIAPKFAPRYRFIVLLPALWVGFEWMRGTILTGFPWLQLGYSATDNWFAGWATISGVIGASFVLATIAGLIAYAIHVGQRAVVRNMVIAVVCISLLSWVLSSVRWTEQVGDALDVTLVQADIPLADKWAPAKRNSIMQIYLAASQAVKQTDLIVWPEAALPMVMNEIPAAYLDELRALEGALIFGGIETQTVNNSSRAYNGLALLQGDQWQIYRKQHLVPFGEYFPLKSLLGWLFRALNIPMSSFSSGEAGQENMQIKGIKLLPTICYEDAFPQDWRQKVSDSNVLLNISEDAWFGDSFAPHQRLQMARMRTIEFQRPLIRVSNTGLSTVIDAFGDTDAISPQFQPAIFNSPVFGMQGETPYTRYGQWPLWAWMVLSLGYSFSRRPKNGA